MDYYLSIAQKGKKDLLEEAKKLLKKAKKIGLDYDYKVLGESYSIFKVPLKDMTGDDIYLFCVALEKEIRSIQ